MSIGQTRGQREAAVSILYVRKLAPRSGADAHAEPARYDRKIIGDDGENIIEPDIAPADRFGSTHGQPVRRRGVGVTVASGACSANCVPSSVGSIITGKGTL